MLYTTFALAKKALVYPPVYNKMAEALGGVQQYGEDTPIPLVRVIEVRGLLDALWMLRCTTDDESARTILILFACDCKIRLRNRLETIQKELMEQATKETVLLSVESVAELAEQIAVESAYKEWEEAKLAEREWQKRHLIELLEGMALKK